MIKQKYVLENYYKGGAFGDIFFAKHLVKDYEVAVKLVIYIITNIVNNSQIELKKKRQGSLRMK